MSIRESGSRLLEGATGWRPAWDSRSTQEANEVVEVSLLLPGEMAGCLEKLARKKGQSLGRMIRGLLRETLAREVKGHEGSGSSGKEAGIGQAVAE